MRRANQLFQFLFITAIVLLSCLSSRAQFSVNAVGYVQIAFSPGYNYCANPLRATNNTVAGLFPNAPNGTSIYIWDVDAQQFSKPSVFDGAWTTNYPLPLGKGFVVYTPARFTNTFVGEVLQGMLTNKVAGGNKLTLLSSLVPQAASLSELNVPARDGDTVYMPVAPTQRLSDAYNYFGGYGWFDPSGAVNTNGPVLPVASCFFMQHPGPDTNWVRNFSVNNAAQPLITSATIKTIQLTGSLVVLNISVPRGESYNVQTSADRISWKTIATNQTATTWSREMVANGVEYFRLQ